MSAHPYLSRETATYASRTTVFVAPTLLCEIAFELDRSNYVQRLRIVSLCGRLEEFLNYAFQVDCIARCRIYDDLIYLGATPNIPGAQLPAEPSDTLEALWQALCAFTGKQFPQPMWNTMPQTDTPMGRGRDLGEAGQHMAYMMDLICYAP